MGPEQTKPEIIESAEPLDVCDDQYEFLMSHDAEACKTLSCHNCWRKRKLIELLSEAVDH